VRHVWVEGTQLVRDRQLQLQDYAGIRANYSQTYARFWDRVAQARKVA
jgi:5-methylthioadenosine/S-adenosylhomocysteine deaminase